MQLNSGSTLNLCNAGKTRIAQFRNRIRERLKLQLSARRNPRTVMAVIVGCSAVVGFFSSMTLLHFGMTSMALRYPLAVGMAYLVFLFLIRFWLAQELEVSGAWKDLPIESGDDRLDVPPPRADQSAQVAPRTREGPRRQSSLDPDPIGIFEFLEDVGFALVLLVAAAASIAFACIYVIWSAPALLAEVLLDGILAAGVYRRVAGLPVDGWPLNVWKRTWFLFAVAVLFCLTAGWAAQHAFPEARSIGAVLGELL